MDYVAALFALVAAVVGVVGDTWDDRQRGLRRLTRTGWVTLACGLAAFGVSIREAYTRNHELGIALSTRREFVLRAYFDLSRALHQIDHPLTRLYAAYQAQVDPNAPFRRWSDLDAAASQRFTVFLSRYNLGLVADDPLALYGESWADFLSRMSGRAQRELQAILGVYGPYLPTEDVLAIDQLRTSELLAALPEHKRYPGSGLPGGVAAFHIEEARVNYLILRARINREGRTLDELGLRRTSRN